jgi:hypothetical protein
MQVKLNGLVASTINSQKILDGFGLIGLRAIIEEGSASFARRG